MADLPWVSIMELLGLGEQASCLVKFQHFVTGTCRCNPATVEFIPATTHLAHGGGTVAIERSKPCHIVEVTNLVVRQAFNLAQGGRRSDSGKPLLQLRRLLRRFRDVGIELSHSPKRAFDRLSRQRWPRYQGGENQSGGNQSGGSHAEHVFLSAKRAAPNERRIEAAVCDRLWRIHATVGADADVVAGQHAGSRR